MSNVNGGLSQQIAHRERIELRASIEYYDRTIGLGTSAPNYSPEWALNADIQTIYLNEVNKDSTLNIARLSTELSNEIPLADLARDETKVSIKPYHVMLSESKLISKTYFDEQTNQAMIALLTQAKEQQRISRLKSLATELEPKTVAKDSVDGLIGELVIAAINLYPLSADRTLMMPDSIVMQLMTAKTADKKRSLWDVFLGFVQGMRVYPQAYPSNDNVCIMLVDSALITYDGMAPMHVDDYDDSMHDKRHRKYGYSTDDFALNATPAQRPHALLKFALTLS